MSFKAELCAKIRALLAGERVVAVACSGGVDSMVLTQILAEVCGEIGVSLRAFIVEHGLRQNSKQHALQTLHELQKRRIDAEILYWRHSGLTSKIEESAREARYGLLYAKMREYGVSKLFLGHHMDDNVETFFLRLAKKSDIFGLSCMDEASARGVMRPMLGFSKREIMDYAVQNGVAYFDDETNAHEGFSRNKLRKNLPEALDLLGLKPEDVAGSVEKIAASSRVLEGFAARVFAEVFSFNSELGIFGSRESRLSDFSDDELMHFFRILLRYFDPLQFYFRYNELRMAVRNLRSKKGFTIGKIEVFWRGNEVFFIKVAKRIENVVSDGVWDGRFSIESARTFKVKTMLRAEVEKVIGEKIGIPAKIFSTLPVVFSENGEFWGFPSWKNLKEVRIKGLEPSRPFNKA